MSDENEDQGTLEEGVFDDPGSVETNGDEGQTVDESQPGGQVPPAPATPAFTADDVTKILTAAQKQQTQTQQPAQQPAQMSDEEFARITQRRVITQEDFKNIFGVDEVNETQVAAFNGLVQDVVRQALTMSHLWGQQQLEQLRGQFQPALSAAQQIQEQQMEQRFVAQYPQLVQYRPLLEATRDQMQKEGLRFQTEAEAFKALADRATAALKAMNISLPAGGESGQNQQPRKQPGMSTVASGGQSGSQRVAGQLSDKEVASGSVGSIWS